MFDLGLLKNLKQKGAMFIEYAMALAFVVVVGVVFISDGSIKNSIASIFGKTGDTLEVAVNGGEKNLIDVKGQTFKKKGFWQNGSPSTGVYDNMFSLDKIITLSEGQYELYFDSKKFAELTGMPDNAFIRPTFQIYNNSNTNILDSGNEWPTSGKYTTSDVLVNIDRDIDDSYARIDFNVKNEVQLGVAFQGHKRGVFDTTKIDGAAWINTSSISEDKLYSAMQQSLTLKKNN